MKDLYEGGYVPVNKQLYDAISQWLDVSDFTKTHVTKPLRIDELECHPVKLRYCVHWIVFSEWYPGREN